MAHHHEDNEHLSPEEIKFNDCIRRGDDLFNIHQYMASREFYNEALEMHFNDKLVNEKLELVTKNKSFETKTVIKILAVAAVIIAAVWIYRTQLPI